jgi:hypothetical protein
LFCGGSAQFFEPVEAYLEDIWLLAQPSGLKTGLLSIDNKKWSIARMKNQSCNHNNSQTTEVLMGMIIMDRTEF